MLRLLGHGGMAYVFLAEDTQLRREIALKVMRPEGLRDPHAEERFLREARLMAATPHEHLVTVFAAAVESGTVYLAMERLEGETLEKRLARAGPPEVSTMLRIAREIATGLDVLHRQGIIHRDLKPSNLWLESPGERVKLLDFGLARFMDDDAQMTQTGMVVGTPGFMSPEQARGEPLDARSDLFSFGAVLYCLATGQQPFGKANTMAVLTALAVSTPTAPRSVNPVVPANLSRLIMRLLDKDADRRPGSAEDVLAELRDIESGKRQPLWRRGTVQALAAGIIPVALLLGYLCWPRPPITHLAMLEPVEVQDWIREPPRRPEMGPFGGVSVQGRHSPHGLFMHAPHGPGGGTTRVSYRLEPRHRAFHVDVALNDGPTDCATPLVFAVYGDGRLLWRSRPIQNRPDRDRCDVNVNGVAILTLELQCPGPARGAHAAWIEPHLR
ncbi:MAG: protein kinase [Gemmataceae bacterium]|nr:protein kinase [Gemmataceae bacterium]